MQVEYVSNDSLFKCWISTYNTLIQYHIGFVTLVTQHEVCATYILKYHELSSSWCTKLACQCMLIFALWLALRPPLLPTLPQTPLVSWKIYGHNWSIS